MKLNNNDDSHNSGLNLLIYNMLLDIESHPAWVCGLKPKFSIHSNNSTSHTLRGCVDWNFGIMILVRIFAVTPCVGVWIETYYGRIMFILKKGHTLRGCVDWNSVIWHRFFWIRSHTLRGCVDWNCSTNWEGGEVRSHTLRGCVDWNKESNRCSWLGSSHTLRGCVDWNIGHLS